jgi:hypothetical protein
MPTIGMPFATIAILQKMRKLGLLSMTVIYTRSPSSPPCHRGVRPKLFGDIHPSDPRGAISTKRCVGLSSDKVPQAFRGVCRLHPGRRIYKIDFPYKTVL